MVHNLAQVVKKNRDPRWEEEFQFTLDEPPTNDRVHVEVISTSKRMGLLHPKVHHFDCISIHVPTNLHETIGQMLLSTNPSFLGRFLYVCFVVGNSGLCGYIFVGRCPQQEDQREIPPYRLKERSNSD